MILVLLLVLLVGGCGKDIVIECLSPDGRLLFHGRVDREREPMRQRRASALPHEHTGFGHPQPGPKLRLTQLEAPA